MSTTDSYTEYEYNILLPGGPGYAEFTLLSQGGMTDALAFEVVTALLGVGWPAGTTVTLDKRAKTEVYSDADLTTTPPTFA